MGFNNDLFFCRLYDFLWNSLFRDFYWMKIRNEQHQSWIIRTWMYRYVPSATTIAVSWSSSQSSFRAIVEVWRWIISSRLIWLNPTLLVTNPFINALLALSMDLTTLLLFGNWKNTANRSFDSPNRSLHRRRAIAVRIDRQLELRISKLDRWSIRLSNWSFDKLVRRRYSFSLSDRSSSKSNRRCCWKNICHLLMIDCTSLELNSLYWIVKVVIWSMASDVKRRSIVCSEQQRVPSGTKMFFFRRMKYRSSDDTVCKPFSTTTRQMKHILYTTKLSRSD